MHLRAPLVVFLLALALAACGTGQPQNLFDARTQGVREAFKKADANGDEQLSREEFASLPLNGLKFDDVDTDGNGQVSLAELISYLDWRRIQADGDRPLDRNGHTIR